MRIRAIRTPLRALSAAILVGFAIGSPVLPASAADSGLSVGPNVNTSRMPGNQAETAIAINPANPRNIVVASNIQFGGQLFLAFSMDGGRTWRARTVANGTDGLPVACCDPSLAADSFGNIYLVYLDQKAHGVPVALSTDGGRSFTSLGTIEDTKSSVKGKHTKAGSKQGPFVDQPTVATGPGSVWVDYKMFARKQLLRAQGAEVTGLGEVGPFTEPLPVPGSREGTFGDIVVGPDGQVLVTYQDNIPTEGPSNVFVNLDPDGLGPEGFGPAIFVTTTEVGGFDFIPPQNLRSVDAETGLAYDYSSGRFHGRVYLVYTDERPAESGNTNIFVRRSNNDGATWSRRIRVNDDATNKSQFNPHIEVDPTSGVVAVSFYDSRNDRGNGGLGDTNGIPGDDAQYWAAISADGGLGFGANVQVSEGTSNAEVSQNGVQYGDYNDMAFFGGSFFPVWADNSDSTGDNPDGTLTTFDVYTARVTVV